MITFHDYGFGKRYEDAHLSRIELPDENMHMLQDWLKNPDRIFAFLGTPGVGKTYFCAALVKYLLEQHKNVRYMSERTLYKHLRDVMNEYDYEHELKRLCDCDYFILDDVGSCGFTDWRRDILFSFLDYRNSNASPTVITSNLFLKDFNEQFSPRFVSRLKEKGNIIMELNWVDKRQQ